MYRPAFIQSLALSLLLVFLPIPNLDAVGQTGIVLEKGSMNLTSSRSLWLKRVNLIWTVHESLTPKHLPWWHHPRMEVLTHLTFSLQWTRISMMSVMNTKYQRHLHLQRDISRVRCPRGWWNNTKRYSRRSSKSHRKNVSLHHPLLRIWSFKWQIKRRSRRRTDMHQRWVLSRVINHQWSICRPHPRIIQSIT